MVGEIMVISHRIHGNFSKKVTCFLNPNQKEKPKCQDFSELISRSERGEHAFFSLSLTQFFPVVCHLLNCCLFICRSGMSLLP